MRKRILIVDDQRDVAMLLHHYIQNEKYEVEEVHSGAEALTRVFAGGFDLVILDYAMRDIKGDRVCMLIREDDKTKELPVIMVTAHSEIDDHVFRQYGATDVLYKPVSADDMQLVIEKYLSK